MRGFTVLFQSSFTKVTHEKSTTLHRYWKVKKSTRVSSRFTPNSTMKIVWTIIVKNDIQNI